MKTKDLQHEKMDGQEITIKLHIYVKDCNGNVFSSSLVDVGMNETFGEISQRLQASFLKPNVPQTFAFMKMKTLKKVVILDTDTPKSLGLVPLDSIDSQSNYFENTDLNYDFITESESLEESE